MNNLVDTTAFVRGMIKSRSPYFFVKEDDAIKELIAIGDTPEMAKKSVEYTKNSKFFRSSGYNQFALIMTICARIRREKGMPEWHD